MSLPPLIQAGLVHYQFEAILPFLDGNGRVGRLLIILFLIQRKVLSTPLLYLSAFFEASRSEYYERLASVSRKGKWNQWLEYFLNGVARMSEDVLSRAERINGLLDNYRRQTSAHKPKVAIKIIDLLAENPFWTTNKLSDRLGVAFTTAQRYINVLSELGILKQADNAQRDRVFFAHEIMAILDEPAKLIPG